MKSIVLALFLAGSSLASLANGPITNKSESAAEVKYVGNSSGEFYFNVQYDNASASRFSVSILDEYGNQLYSGVYSDRKFDKNFKLADAESFGKLVFVIRNFGDNSIQRFEVKADNRLVEDVVVKEVR
jgi:hypothetical protein